MRRSELGPRQGAVVAPGRAGPKTSCLTWYRCPGRRSRSSRRSPTGASTCSAWRAVRRLVALKRRLDQRILEARRKLDPKAQPMPHWTLHDLRRTGTTAMNDELEIAPHVVEAVINHISGAAKKGVAGTYNRAQYLGARTLALQAWADHVTAELIARWSRSPLGGGPLPEEREQLFEVAVGFARRLWREATERSARTRPMAEGLVEVVLMEDYQKRQILIEACESLVNEAAADRWVYDNLMEAASDLMTGPHLVDS